MMMSWHGEPFHITDPLWGECASDRWFPFGSLKNTVESIVISPVIRDDMALIDLISYCSVTQSFISALYRISPKYDFNIMIFGPLQYSDTDVCEFPLSKYRQSLYWNFTSIYKWRHHLSNILYLKVGFKFLLPFLTVYKWPAKQNLFNRQT